MFLSQIFRPENFVYSVILIIVLIYWIIVTVGLLDVESIDLNIDLSIDSLFTFLNLGKIPFSIWFTVFSFIIWVLSLSYNSLFDNFKLIDNNSIFRFIAGFILLLPTSIFITKLLTNPLRRFFDFETIKKSDFISKECVVTSSTVTNEFGIAELSIEGQMQLVDIRTKNKEEIKKGDRVLIYQYDDNNDIFYVTKIDF